MSRRRRDTIVASLALTIVAALTVSPAGAELRRALSARNSASVNGIRASLVPRPSTLVPLDAAARLPRKTLRPGTGVRGLRGDEGPRGETGARGVPGAEGPGAATVYRNPTTFGPFAGSFPKITTITATDVPPGTWLAFATIEAHRQSGGEYLVGCALTNEVTTHEGTLAAIGAEHGGSGQVRTTLLTTGVFHSDLSQDIALRCDGTQFGGGDAAFLSDPALVLVRVPAAAARIGGS